ncbi:hypothetical protein [Microcoleus sp. MON2_D5]|uniref:hypothetical protein n=1 Tax=Microcoleus sp. MON2_D5 TaxID=2818833 RepID=UPI002FCFFD4C
MKYKYLGKNMTDSEHSQQPEVQTPQHNNIKLIHEHLEYQIALVNRSIDISVTKVGFVLGLTTGLILFKTTVHLTSNGLLFLDVFSIILCLVTLGFCLAGFQPKSGGVLLLAKTLYDEHYYDSEETFFFTLTSVAMESLDSLTVLRDFRAKMANYAIWCLCTTIACEAIGWIGFELLLFLK